MANSDPNNGEKSSSDAEIKVINKIPRTPPKPTHTSRRNTVSNVSIDRRSSSCSGNDKGRDRSASVKRKRDPIESFCGVCNNEFGRGIKNCVECDLCSRWFHYLCVNLTAEELSAITLLGDKVCWHCPACSIGAANLHKQTKLLNDKISKVSAQVNDLETVQTATTEEIITIKENVATNVSNIARNTTRLNSAKEDIAKLSVTEKANTTKITALNDKVESICKNMKEDIQKQVDNKASADAINAVITKKVDEKLNSMVNEDGTPKINSDAIEQMIKKEVDERLKTVLNEDGTLKTVNAPIIKKAVENKVTELYKAEFPTLVERMDDSEENQVIDTHATKTYYPSCISKAVQEEMDEREEIRKRKINS